MRERLIDATLTLAVRQGIDATTTDQIAALAQTTTSEFASHFASLDEVIVSTVEDLLGAVATAVVQVNPGVTPERAMLIGATNMLRASFEGNGVITRDRLLAVARIVTATPRLQKESSAARNQILVPALAQRMNTDPADRRVQRAATLWSAIVAAAYVAQASAAEEASLDNHQIADRVVAELTANFVQITGQDPPER